MYKAIKVFIQFFIFFRNVSFNPNKVKEMADLYSFQHIYRFIKKFKKNIHKIESIFGLAKQRKNTQTDKGKNLNAHRSLGSSA